MALTKFYVGYHVPYKHLFLARPSDVALARAQDP